MSKSQQQALAAILAGQVENIRNGREPSGFGFMNQLQAAAAASSAKRKTHHHNPRPPGVIQPGSATDAVYSELKRTGAALTEAQLLWVTKRSHSAVSWALLRLAAWKLIEKIPDPTRHARYNRYRAVKTGGGDGQ